MHRPLLIAGYVYELAQGFNDFYHACPVLQSEEPTRTARLALTAGLALLGIADGDVTRTKPHQLSTLCPCYTDPV